VEVRIDREEGTFHSGRIFKWSKAILVHVADHTTAGMFRRRRFRLLIGYGRTQCSQEPGPARFSSRRSGRRKFSRMPTRIAGMARSSKPSEGATKAAQVWPGQD